MSFFKKLLGKSEESSGDADAAPADPQDIALANNIPDPLGIELENVQITSYQLGVLDGAPPEGGPDGLASGPGDEAEQGPIVGTLIGDAIGNAAGDGGEDAADPEQDITGTGEPQAAGFMYFKDSPIVGESEPGPIEDIKSADDADASNKLFVGGLSYPDDTAAHGEAGEQTYLKVELEDVQGEAPGDLASGPGDKAPGGDPSARAFPTETIAPGDVAFPTETITPGDGTAAGDDRPTEEIAFYYNKVGSPPDEGPGDLASGPGGEAPADADVDGRDYMIWQRNLGTRASDPVGEVASGPGDEAGDPLANFEIQTPDPGEALGGVANVEGLTFKQGVMDDNTGTPRGELEPGGDGGHVANFEIQTPRPEDDDVTSWDKTQEIVPGKAMQTGHSFEPPDDAPGDLDSGPGDEAPAAGGGDLSDWRTNYGTGPAANTEPDGPSVLFDQAAQGEGLYLKQAPSLDLDPDMPDPSDDDLPDV